MHHRRSLGLLVALFFSLVAIDLLLVRDWVWLSDAIFGERFWVNYLISSFVFWVFLFTIRGLGGTKRIPRTLLATVIGVAFFAQTAYFGVYGKFVTVFDIRFFFADPILTLSLWSQSTQQILPIIVGSLAGYMMYRVIGLSPSPRRWLIWSKGIFGGLLFAVITLNWYGAPTFQFAPVAYVGNFLSAIEFDINRDDYPPKPELEERSAARDAPSIVFVVGESLNASHMGLYGYDRDSTPKLDALEKAGSVVAMRNAVSIGTRTLLSVPYMLTGLQGIDPHGVIYSVPTIFNYAKSAGYQTALITSQDFQWRDIDKLFVDQDLDYFRQGVDFSPSANVLTGADDQLVLQTGIKPWIESTKASGKPFMLVTQMSGSHYPFSSQVPQAFKQFLPEESESGINAYDNTVWYTDFYLSGLLESVREADPNSWVFYSTDHGQHVAGDGKGFHGDLSPAVIHNALLVFPPQQYSDQIAAQIESPVSQADIFATILDLMDVDPVAPIDGLSLLSEIPNDRMRITSAYMKTLHNDPVAALVFPDRSLYVIDFSRGSVSIENTDEVMDYDQLDPAYRRLFNDRLTAQ